VGLFVIRDAVAGDADWIIGLLWDHRASFVVGTPCRDALAAHVRDLIGSDVGKVLVTEARDGCAGAWLSDPVMTREAIASGLWLVARRQGDGLRLARAMVAWAHGQGAIAVCSARPELAGFYQRLGLSARETVFAG
jgi:GNAT superfamily N-acetyltransferase